MVVEVVTNLEGIECTWSGELINLYVELRFCKISLNCRELGAVKRRLLLFLLKMKLMVKVWEEEIELCGLF